MCGIAQKKTLFKSLGNCICNRSCIFVRGGFIRHGIWDSGVKSVRLSVCLPVSTIKIYLNFTPISWKFCQSTSYGLVSYGYERHYDPSIFRPIFMHYCSSVSILYIGNQRKMDLYMFETLPVNL